MAKLTKEQVVEKFPQLAEVVLDGTTDYSRIDNLTGFQYTSTVIFEIINALKTKRKSTF